MNLTKYIDENELDFASLNVFKYYDEVNMFIPQKTIRNEDKQILSCESDSLGTFCVKDVNEWLLNFSDSVSESEDNISFLSSDSYIMSKSIESDNKLLNSSDKEIEPVNVVFAVDRLQFIGAMSLSRPAQIKQNIINVSEKLFERYTNVNIYIVFYDDASYIEICNNIDSVKNIVNKIPFPMTQSLSQCIEKPINDVKVFLSNLVPNYYFIYNGTYFNPNPPETYREQFESSLKQEKSCHMCFVSAGSFLDPDYINYYANNYSGKVFNLFSETIDDVVLNFIAKEPKLKSNSSYVTPGTDDEPSEDEPVKTEPSNRYIISSNLTTVTLDAPLTKNSKVDSDNDGLIDVEELISNCKLIKWDDDGNIILPTLVEVIQDYGMDSDFLLDNILANSFLKDGLLTEILPVRSNPVKEDSDLDGIIDSTEIFNHNSNPLKYNKIVSIQDIDVLTENDKYGASALKGQYDGDGILTEISVFISNNFFGSVHDYKIVYKEALLNYFEKTNSSIVKKNNRVGISIEDEQECLYFANIGTQIEAVISKALKLNGLDYDNVNSVYYYILRDLESTGKSIETNLFKYYSGKISKQVFVDENYRLMGSALDNKAFRDCCKTKLFGASVKFLDNVNSFVTIASIVESGAVAINTSIDDMFSVILYGNIIENNINTLIKIEYNTNSINIRKAARELRDEIESKSLTFFVEMENLSRNFCNSVGDGLSRMAIANCKGVGTLIIAEIAITDMVFSVSDVGLNFLQCYIYAEISCVLSSLIKDESAKCEVNGTEYEYITIGEYIIYGCDESNHYIYGLKNLCTSRILGEESIVEMKHWNSLLWVKIMGNDKFFENIDDNIVCVNNIKEKY